MMRNDIETYVIFLPASDYLYMHVPVMGWCSICFCLWDKSKVCHKYMHTVVHVSGAFSQVCSLGHKTDKVMIGCYMKGHLERELSVIMIMMVLSCESV